MTSVFHLLAGTPHIGSDRLALSMRRNLREDRWSYLELWREVNRAAQHLCRNCGLEKGDRVILVAANEPRTVLAQLAVMRAGLTLVPLDVTATGAFIEEVGRQTEAKAMLGDGTLIPPIGVRHIPVKSLLCSGEELDGELPSGDDIAEIIFTSGTTGTPKGVILTHGNIAANVEAILSVVPKRQEFRLLSILPLSHMFEQTVGLAMPLLLGGSIHYVPGRQPPVIRQALERFNITCMVVVPQLLDLMLKGIEREARERTGRHAWDRAHAVAANLPMPLRRLLFRRVITALGGHLSFFMSGGAYLPPETARAWECMGIRVMQGYGATECSPVITSSTFEDRAPGTVGHPLPGVDVRLSDENEIQVRGKNVTPGYWRDQIRTSEAFTEDGWLRTGDLGQRDSGRRLVVNGRLKDMIVLPSGLNVMPEDVERELACEPEITESVVVGKQDNSGNVHVHAVLRAEAAPERLAAAIRSSNSRLGSHQQIGSYGLWTVGDFPKTALGKVKRNLVREAIESRDVTEPAKTAAPNSSPPDRLRAILAAICELSPDDICERSDLRLDLGLDSLAGLELVGALERELGVALDESQFQEVHSFGELAALVAKTPKKKDVVQFARWPLSPPARRLRSLLQSAILIPLQRLICTPFAVEGDDKLVAMDSPCLFVANHSSHMDAPAVIRALPPRLGTRTAIAAADDYFYGHGLAGRLLSLLLNGFPFSRTGNVRASFDHCGDLADNGWSILMFPEGTRSNSGQSAPFRSGIGLLATGLRVPVVPIGLIGGFDILPKGRTLPRRGPLSVRIGDPLTFAEDTDPADVTAALETAVEALLPPELRRACR